MSCRIGSIGLRVLVLLFAFVLGVSLTRIFHNTQKNCRSVRIGSVPVAKHLDYASSPRVTFCDLRATPELYEGKVVLLPIKSWKPGMLRSDEICVKGDSNFEMEFVGRAFRESGSEEFWRGGEVTLAGRFVKSPFADAKPNYQFHVFAIYEARLSSSPLQ